MTFLASRMRPGPKEVFWLVLAGVAAAPLSTKLAGAAWVFLCLSGLWAALRRPRTSQADDGAAKTWLAACLVGLALETLATAIWHDPWDELHAPIRLMLAAAATLALVRRFHFSDAWRDRFAHALALACVAALGLALWKGDNRNDYPTNVIPWAVATGFMVCLLLPRTVDATRPLALRFAWMLAAFAGFLAVVLTQTRGAYGIVLWVPLFYAGAVWRQRRVTRLGMGIVAAVAVAALMAAILLPHRVQTSLQRVRLAANEFTQAAEPHRPGEGANSSVGARVYLWEMATRSFAESPLIGVGEAERKRRIQALGERMNSPLIAELGHVHSQYLHSAMDHGVLGLAAVLAWMAGLALAGLRAGRRDGDARWQLAGILFMHATASLTNANFAHTYYGVMLSLCVSLVLLTAKGAKPAAAGR